MTRYSFDKQEPAIFASIQYFAWNSPFDVLLVKSSSLTRPFPLVHCSRKFQLCVKSATELDYLYEKALGI